MVPAITAILDSPDLHLDGFIGPGHVSTVIGLHPYGFIADERGKPVVVSGFEPLDVLQSVEMLLRQFAEGRCEIENQYQRVVRPRATRRRSRRSTRRWSCAPTFEWRGLGFIPESAMRIRPEFADWDAEVRFELPGVRVADPKACQCGEVLKGAIKPWECKVFGTACTPEQPIGTCMVSSEGACAAYYNYGRHSGRRKASRRRLMASGRSEQEVLDAIEARRRRPRRKVLDERITLSHGAGGKACHDLVEGIFLREFSQPLLEPLGDAALVGTGKDRLAFTTDSFVVRPLFFPGRRHRRAGGERHDQRPGDDRRDAAGALGRLHRRGGAARRGPRADRGVDGRARPRRPACRIATGDTKVVERGKADGLYINTSGVGVVEHEHILGPRARSEPATGCSSPARSATTAWR